jgi:hypothetical protein
VSERKKSGGIERTASGAIRTMTGTFVAPAEAEPREPTAEEGRSNALFGLGLFAISLLLFAGTVAVALVYLALD